MILAFNPVSSLLKLKIKYKQKNMSAYIDISSSDSGIQPSKLIIEIEN